MQRDVVTRLKEDGSLVRCTTSDAEIDVLKFQSEEELAAAKVLSEANFNDQALRHLWDSARFMLEAFLAYQGLAVKAVGDKHKVTIEATQDTQVGASLPAIVKKLDKLRTRRNDLAYPQEDTQPAFAKEVGEYQAIIEGLHCKYDEITQNLRCF